MLGRDELPRKVDKDPAWRATAVSSCREVEAIISDERIPLDRRVVYALLAFTGCRFGEVAALRWRVYDRTQEPLGLLSVHASYSGRTGREKDVKTGAPRSVPAYLELTKALAEWKVTGWPALHGSPADRDDLIAPRDSAKNRSVRHGLRRFHQDLARLGLRRRRVHEPAADVRLARAGGRRPQGRVALDHARPRGRYRRSLHDATLVNSLRGGQQAPPRGPRRSARAVARDHEGTPEGLLQFSYRRAREKESLRK